MPLTLDDMVAGGVDFAALGDHIRAKAEPVVDHIMAIAGSLPKEQFAAMLERTCADEGAGEVDLLVKDAVAALAWARYRGGKT
jgi:hypothetical protein